MATLTVANSVITTTIDALYPTGVRLTGYSADDVFEIDNVETGEYQMGIDGKLSAGFVYNEIPVTITLSADSPSVQMFENVFLYEVANRTKLANNWTITLPALGRRYDLKQGFVKSYKAPSGKKILQPAVVQLVFARLEASAI